MPFGLETVGLTIAEEKLEPGDWLVLYTDGVTEARNASGEWFGEELLVDFLTREMAASQPPAETVRRLTQAVLATRAGCSRTTPASCWPAGDGAAARGVRSATATATHARNAEPAPWTRDRPDRTDDALPLAGYTVAVTAARRKEELGALLDRRGARVVYAPAIRIVPLSDDAELVAATREVLAAPVDLVVATTGVGFRGWLEAADAWDLPLVEHLRSARVLARGPEGARRDPRRRAGRRLVTGVGVVGRGARAPAVRRRGPAGGTPDRRPAARGPAARPRRRAAGDRRRGAAPCRSTAGCCPRTSRRCAGWSSAIVAGGVDAVTFTSAPAAASLLAVADELGQRAAMVAAFNGRVLAIAVGPVTAGPLEAAGMPSRPARTGPARRAGPRGGRPAARARPGAAGRRRTRCRCAGTPPSSTAGWSSCRPGPWRCCGSWPAGRGTSSPGPDLIAALPGGGDGHAVEMAVTRLRAALGRPRRRDRGQARLPPGDLKPLVGRRRTGHHAGRRRCEGSRP